MFNNIGGKIKTVSKFICYAGIAVSVICGVIMLFFGVAGNLDMSAIGLAVGVGGSLCSWLGSLAAYGFGELIENTTVIAELMAKTEAEKNGK